ncbi:MAG: hypothetical protein RLZZ543_524 [Bacteroidota bacterium]
MRMNCVICNMMKAILFSECAAVALLSACGGPAVKPEVYNDSLVIQQIRVVDKADELQDAFNSYVEAEMRMRHQQLERQIEASLAQVNKMEDYDGDDAFRKSTLSMLDGYKQLVGKEYTEAEKILSQPDSLYSDSDEARLELLYKEIDKLSDELTANFKRAQEEFAKKHKLNLNKESEASH